MALDKLRNLKKKETKILKKSFHRYLVIGDSLFPILAWQKLSNKYGHCDVGLLTESRIEMDGLRLTGPSPFRGIDNLACIRELYPNIEQTACDHQSVFFKDGQWRSFNGRSKSETLLFAEPFFTIPRTMMLQNTSEFLVTNANNIDEINQNANIHIISSISRISNEELIDEKTWSIRTSDGHVFECEYLIWGRPERDFFNLLDDKSIFSNKFLEFYDSNGKVVSVFVKFVFEDNVESDLRTYFIPLSHTHEWGHFIGEFIHNDEDNGCREVDFVHFLNEIDTNEDEVAKRIKILQRGLEKVFPNIDFKKATRYITLKNESPCMKIDTCHAEKDIPGMKKLFFTGINAPVEHLMSDDSCCEYSLKEVSHFTRGLLSISLINC